MHSIVISPLRLLLFVVAFSLTVLFANKLMDDEIGEEIFGVKKSETQVGETKEEFRAKEVDDLPKEIEIVYEPITMQLNGSNRKYGNVISVQTQLYPVDFISSDALYNRLKNYLDLAKEKNSIDAKTVFVFPEHIGTGLALAGEGKKVFSARTVATAFQEIISEQPRDFKTLLESSNQSNKEAHALIQFKSEKMAREYVSVFSRLAKEYATSIQAGTILLSNPSIDGNKIQTSPGAVYNCAFTFLPTGDINEVFVKKEHLSDWEKFFVTPGSPTQERLVVVPGWKFGILPGKDAFFPDSYNSLKGRPMDAIVSPASSFEPLAFSEDEIKEIGTKFPNVEESELWIRFSLGNRIRLTRAVESIQAFSVGNFYDLPLYGISYTIRDFKAPDKANPPKSPKLLNLYF